MRLPSPVMLQLDQVAVTYEGRAQAVVSDISFALPSGDIACLLGPSGCGKTTVLRAIAGFAAVTHGCVQIAGKEVASAQEQVPTEQRQVGMVFQDYALFPHLNVAANVGFGLHRLPSAERRARVAEMLQLVGLEALAKRSIHELSGGQQQRVALARALAPRPKLLLLDEPFSNLDVALRERLATEVRDLLKATGTTVVMVTHDQREAFAMADHIAVMADQRIQQWGAPLDIYHEPVNRLVADFVGEGSWISAQILERRHLACELGSFRLPRTAQAKADKAIDLLIRADDILHDDDSPTHARVVAKTFRGTHFLYTLALPSGQKVLSLVPSHHDHALGSDIGIRLELNHLVYFEASEVALASFTASSDALPSQSVASYERGLMFSGSYKAP